MPELNLTDSNGRDARVAGDSVTQKLEMRWLDEDQTQVGTQKILRSNLDHDIEKLLADADGNLEHLADLLVEGDPEVDLENFGRFLSETSRVYLNEDREIVHKLSHWEVVKDPEGNEKERRPKQQADPNVASEMPLKWTGKKVPKEKAARQFVFSGKIQLSHVNGLTYDFLYAMAKELADDNVLMMLGGGPKGAEPLTFRRGGLAYRGFLEGRIDGAAYALILHLTNQELKLPATTTADD